MNTEKDELLELWKSYDDRLERSLRLNEQVLEKLETLRVTTSFDRVVRLKTGAVVFGMFWNAFLVFLIYHTWREPFFTISAGLSFMINIYAMIEYVRQITMIRSLDFSAPVTETQALLNKLLISVIQVMRVIPLSLPLYTTFYIKLYMIGNAGTAYWIIQTLVTAGAVALSAWLYKYISIENRNSRIVNVLIRDDGGRSIAKAEQFLEEITAFRKEEK
ncbi:hypothetical protein [Chitinophaga barathri]|uniref:Uncharacterized protein n=1 Tax=Chitinophaga barathri TaxID=1647451 RepID=A0A3N4MCE8_9BACT|nr:hypothetical protein [Chitinophaga barathri]RPD39167.1 hypothetical protein EG028_21385 [Chitinophaga barathri]